MLKRVFILLFVLILSISIVIATQSYNETGNFDSYYQLGIGQFNENLPAYDTERRVLTTPRQIPLVSDLDNDGINEIIVIDSGNIRLYHGRDLDIVDTLGLSTSGEVLSNLIAYNIDDDDKIELIFTEIGTELIKIVEWNGTNFIVQTQHNISDLTYSTGNAAVKCKSKENCIMVYGSLASTPGSSLGRLFAVGFNSTYRGSELKLLSPLWANGVFCMPHINSIAVADYDSPPDTNLEYITTVSTNDPSGDMVVYTLWLDVNESKNVSIENSNSDTTSSLTHGTSCSNQIARAFTSPLTFDSDNSPSNGLETFVGIMHDSDEFFIRKYDGNGVAVERFPLVLEADGRLVSNLFRADIFDDSGNFDFCAVGYEKVDERMDILCGTDLDSVGLFDNVQFKFDTDGTFNISESLAVYNNIAHSTQHKTQTIHNIHEVINAYGIFELDFDSCSILTANCDIERIWENPQGDSALISVDVEKVNKEDLIALTPTHIYYFDDLFSFTPAFIKNISFNPCINSQIKQNSSFEIVVTVDDVDNDFVGARVIVYLDTPSEIDFNWSNNVTTEFGDVEFPFSGVYDEIIGTGTIRAMARDVRQPTEIDIIDTPFSVGLNGVEFGDCVTNLGFEIVEVEEEIEEEFLEDLRETDVIDNPVTNAMTTLQGLFGIGATLLWFIFMLIVTWGLWVTKVSESSPNTSFGVIIIANVLMLIIGTILGFIGAGLIITFSVLGIIAIGVWISRFIIKTRA